MSDIVASLIQPQILSAGYVSGTTSLRNDRNEHRASSERCVGTTSSAGAEYASGRISGRSSVALQETSG